MAERVEREIDRVLTQYRESPKLLHMLRTYLGQVENIITTLEVLPEAFDIQTTVGDQLTLLGKRLGWPRCHCICVAEPVFGFYCPGVPQDFSIVGFCEQGSWVDCGDFGIGDICISDDEIYRGFLLARRYQMLSLYDRASLTQALQHIWGPTAMVIADGNGRAVMTPGRSLTAQETALLQLVPRVLPIAPGILQRFHFGGMPVFGFGEGWGGFCEFSSDGLPLATEDGDILVTELDEEITTGPLVEHAEWMCQIDLKPYECTT